MALREIIGIAAGIAAAAGLAAAASKAAQKEQEEQRKLELQQGSLEMERQESAHHRQLEQQQMLEDARQREHQRRLDNAPKKVIYKPVSLECPKCMGHREIHRDTAQAVCPYCDFVEQLVVDRYVIDQEAFQKQLQEEELQRQQRLKRQNQLLLCWGVIGGVVLIGLPFAFMMGLFSVYICWAIIAVALMLTYPKLEPILWFVIFPVPLTGILLHHEEIKRKFDAKYRYLMIVGAWVVYVVLLGVLLMFDVYGSSMGSSASVVSL